MGYWVAVITQRSIVDPFFKAWEFSPIGRTSSFLDYSHTGILSIAEQPSFLATRTSVLTLPVTAYLVLIPADRVGEAVFASI